MKRIIPVLMFLLFLQVGLADNTVNTCLAPYNLNVSQQNVTIYNATDGTILIPLSENITCPFYCNNITGKCNASPYDVGLADIGIVFGLMGLAFFFIWLSNKEFFDIPLLKGRFTIDPLQILFFFSGFFIAWIDTSYFVTLVNNLNKTAAVVGLMTSGYSVVMYSVWIGFGMFFLYFIYSILTMWMRFRRR